MVANVVGIHQMLDVLTLKIPGIKIQEISGRLPHLEMKYGLVRFCRFIFSFFLSGLHLTSEIEWWKPFVGNSIFSHFGLVSMRLQHRSLLLKLLTLLKLQLDMLQEENDIILDKVSFPQYPTSKIVRKYLND